MGFFEIDPEGGWGDVDELREASLFIVVFSVRVVCDVALVQGEGVCTNTM